MDIPGPTSRPKVLLLANTDWFLYRFNAHLARRLRALGAEVVLAAPRGDYSRRFEEEGFRWLPLSIERRRVLPWKELETHLQLRRMLRQEQPDWVHGFTLKACLHARAAMRLGPLRRRPTVCSITGLGFLYASRGLKARLLRPVMETVGRRLLPDSELIFLNPDDQREFQRLGLATPDGGTVIAGSGVDVAAFSPQPWEPAPGDDDSAPCVVLPARLLLSKGIADFAAAAESLLESGVEARFAVVGSPDPDNPDAVPRAQLDAWRRRGTLELWGFQSNMVEVYRQARVVCLPSFYREGVPTVLLEAAACGRPVVTTDMPGCRDAVDHGVTGLRVPPRNAPALAEALAELLPDAARCRAMGEAGRRFVVERFSVERVVEATLDVYRRIGLRLPGEACEDVRPELSNR